MVVVHGGPGACGELAPVARELARRRGVLEPIQTAPTVGGQVAELAAAVEEAGAPPVTLVGHSWGAWLACLLASAHPRLVRVLVLVGAPPFEQKYVPTLEARRAARMSDTLRERKRALEQALVAGNGAALAELGELYGALDAVDREQGDARPEDLLPCDPNAALAVWNEAAELRRSGALLEATRRIRCPVVVIHGVEDPHPTEGVMGPLQAALSGGVRLVALARCGHTPWRERQAREAFYQAVEAAIDPGMPATDAPRR